MACDTVAGRSFHGYYEPRTVADSKTIPLHPGALKYYRERGYIK